MPTGVYERKKAIPICHPNRKHRSLGLCLPCYQRLRYVPSPRTIPPATCHPEKRHWAKGLCRQCWNKQYNKVGATKTFALGGVELPKGFYTYLWLREDGSPYYVGKGKGNRGFSVRTHRVHPPQEVCRIIPQEFETEEDALFAEMLLISVYGREDLGTGRLLNLTDGGDNPPHSKRTKESIEKGIESRRMGKGWSSKKVT